MTLCRLTGVEPYITVNSGFADARSAAEYVEYANSPATTTWGAKRAANGHPEPYHVRFWNIGNEMWGSYQYGYMPLAQYVVKHNLFAEAMRKVDPGIVLIGSGAMPDTMTGSKESLKLGDKLIPDYLGPADWTGGLFLKMPRQHGHDQRALLQLRQPLRPRERQAGAQRSQRASRRLDAPPGQSHPPQVRGVPGVLSASPPSKKKPIPIALDEYAYAGAATTRSFPPMPGTSTKCSATRTSTSSPTLTFVTATYSASNGQAVLNPVGMLFKFYRDRFGTIPVDVSGNSPQPKPKYPPGGEQPVVNAGSDTFPLDVAAAWTDRPQGA